jgi:signal peptidase I
LIILYMKEELGVKAVVIEVVKTMLLACIIIIPIRVFLFQPFFVDGESMYATLKNHDYLLVYEHGYKQVSLFGTTLLHPSKELVRGDIVVFHPPLEDKRPPSLFRWFRGQQSFVKRVIGLPGESVAIIGGKVVVYSGDHPVGEVLVEPYIAPGSEMVDMPKVTLTDDQYFMMGDNRMFSYDSRQFGPVSKASIVGKALIRAWPLGTAGIL